MKTKLDHRQKLAAARHVALKLAPYYATALFSMVFVPVEGMLEKHGAAMGVTKTLICHYDPRVVTEEWTLDDLVFGLLHEVGHILRDHAQRCEENGYEHATWNLAGDAAINDDLVAMGLKPLKTDMLPAKIKDDTGSPMRDGLTEEAYYDALTKQGGDGDGDGDGDESQGQQPNGKPGRPGSRGTPCGGCSGNKVSDDLEGDDSTKGRSAVEVERVKKQVAREIKEHIKEHGAGSVPGGLSRWADAQLEPAKVAWQDKLRQAALHGVEKVRGMLDYTYQRPSRRQSAMGYGANTVLLPSMYAPKPRVMVAVDTSGSMGSADLVEAMSEVDGVIKEVGGEITIGICDAEMHGGLDKVRTVSEACDMLKGGGGTDFRPIFAAVEEASVNARPHIVIVATDGDGPAPELPPSNVTVIWLLVGSHAVTPYTSGRGRVEWGEKIWLKEAA
jgi:predicted metal-dependent peptidase